MMARWLLLLAAVLTLACERAQRAPEDAHGGASLVIDTTPSFMTAAGSPADSLAEIGLPTGATRLTSGVVAVGDGYLPGVRFFAPSGEQIRTTGRRGSGPNEFQSLDWLGQCRPDSIFAWDAAAGQMSVIDTAGRVVRRFPVSGNPGYFACAPGVLAVLAIPRQFAAPSKSPPHEVGELTLRDAEGRIMHSWGEIPYGENRPLGKLTRIAVGRERLWVGTADSPFVDVYATDGRRIGTMATGGVPRPPTASHYSRAIDALIAPITNRAFRDVARQQLLEIPMPEAVPPYSGVLADPEGALWVVTSWAGDGETRFRVISAGGDAQDASIPAEITVLEVGRDYILGVVADRLGAPQVALYGVNRP